MQAAGRRRLALALLMLPILGFAQPAAKALPFAEMFVMPVGPRGLEPTPALLAAQGRPVLLTGYMVRQERALPGRFLLTPTPVTMSEHADGDADDMPIHAVTVWLPAQQRDRIVAHRDGLLRLQGLLEYGPSEDETGRVSWLRLRLAPDALERDASIPSSSSAAPAREPGLPR